MQMRQIENQFLAVDPRRLGEIPERIVDMVGYQTHRPFIGYGQYLPVDFRCVTILIVSQPMD